MVEDRNLRQVIVMRTDLEMSRGKMIAQGAHAAMAIIVDYPDDPRVKEWLLYSFTKVVVYVKSELKLLQVAHAAREAGMLVVEIRDAGRTEVEPETLTCIAIGPDTPENLAPVTGKLQLLK